MDGYKVTIVESSKELTAKERIAMKDTSNAIKLDEVTKPEEPFVFTPVFYASIHVDNPNSEDKEYTQYIFVDNDGTKYMTGSKSFFDSFLNIWNEMDGEQEEWSIEVTKHPSKKYSGKFFLTASIV